MIVPTSAAQGYLRISVLDSAPKDTEFTSLADHVSSTPASFSLETDPVLHYNLDSAILKVLDGGLSLLPVPPTLAESPILDKTKVQEDGLKCQAKVASSRLFLWFPEAEFGYAIPYPSITLHGIADAASIYLQIASGSGDDTEFAEFYLVTSTGTAAPTENADSDTKAIYDALCTCAGMHADPGNSDDEDEDGTGNGGIALDMDIDMGLEDENANGDDDGWTSNNGVTKNGNGHGLGEIEQGELGSAGLEITIDEAAAVRAGMRRRRSEQELEGNEQGDEVDAAGVSNGSTPAVDEGAAEKWRRTS